VYILINFIRRTGTHVKLGAMFYILESQILFQSTHTNCFY